jgi:hypothetical protein
MRTLWQATSPLIFDPPPPLTSQPAPPIVIVSAYRAGHYMCLVHVLLPVLEIDFSFIFPLLMVISPSTLTMLL